MALVIEIRPFALIPTTWSLGYPEFIDFSFMFKQSGGDQIFQLQMFWNFLTNSFYL